MIVDRAALLIPFPLDLDRSVIRRGSRQPASGTPIRAGGFIVTASSKDAQAGHHGRLDIAELAVRPQGLLESGIDDL